MHNIAYSVGVWFVSATLANILMLALSSLQSKDMTKGQAIFWHYAPLVIFSLPIVVAILYYFGYFGHFHIYLGK